jgi:hypothetical protein
MQLLRENPELDYVVSNTHKNRANLLFHTIKT